MVLAPLPEQAIPIVAGAALSELMPVSYLIKRKAEYIKRESEVRKIKTESEGGRAHSGETEINN